MQSWYEVAQGAELRQGSLLRAFPIAKPPKNITKNKNGEYEPIMGKLSVEDIVILSQSCDLAQNKSGLVLVAPVMTLERLSQSLSKNITNDEVHLSKFWEQIRSGHQPPLHMLAACDIEAFQKDIEVVDFRQAITVSYAYITRFAVEAGSHLRLAAPFREHLSQAYARFMMRVALEKEAEIPRFSPLP